MPDKDETGATVELAVEDRARYLPDSPRDLRAQLPGIEPERRVTDWGRSERVEAVVDRTVYEFLYHYWFRVEVEGIENVPADGGGLLVANHAGAIASDAAMVAKAIREEHRRRRPLQLATESSLAALPGLAMLVTKLGGVASHPANIHRLLFDEDQLVLVFPEGVGGARKALSQRYRLRAFDRFPFVATAVRARVPIVPVAILGAEEAIPTFASLRSIGRLARLPLTTGVPLPAKFRIRFLEPVDTEALGAGGVEIEDPGRIEQLQNGIRALIQENLLELVAQRRSIWLG